MKPWFIWNGMNSDAMGLWISKLPKITRAPERYEQVEIPGRAGKLTLLEGDDVYDDYVKEVSVQTVNWNPLLHEVINKLRGEGDMVFSNEIDRVYHGRIAPEVAFERLGNSLLQAKIQIITEPFKRNRYEAKDRISSSDSVINIYNPGDVASRPYVSVTGVGNYTGITIGGVSMGFDSLTGTIDIDCDAEVITYLNSGVREIWTGSYIGEFWKIPVGASQIAVTGGASIVLDPKWRWV